MNTIEKIQKLLELSKTSHYNENEAFVALKKAQELAFKNDLSIEDIEFPKDEVETKSMEFKTKKLSHHVTSIASVIGANFKVVTIISSNGSSQKLKVVGMQQDIQIFASAFMFCLNFFESGFKKSLKEYKEKVDTDRATSVRLKNTYFLGFIKGLEQSFKSNVQELGIVLVRNSKVDDFVDSLNLSKSKPAFITTQNSPFMQSKGFTDGSNFSYKAGSLADGR